MEFEPLRSGCEEIRLRKRESDEARHGHQPHFHIVSEAHVTIHFLLPPSQEGLHQADVHTATKVVQINAKTRLRGQSIANQS